MRPRLVALLVAAALTTGWLAASIVSPPVAELQTLPARADRPDPSRDVPVDRPFTEQLQIRMQSAPPPPVPRRNPFLFGDRGRAAGESVRAGAVSALPPEKEVAAVAVQPALRLRLAGIGTNASPDGVVRTAVIADGTTVHLVKIGETVAGYAVVEITDDAVIVRDGAGEPLTLRLR